MVQVTAVQTADAPPWQCALDRALANALDVYVEPLSGEAFVESASRPGILYAVTAMSCTCKAGQQGQVCMHRACYLAQMGMLPLEAPMEPCRYCGGAGSSFSEYWMERRRCDACDGTGVHPPQRPDGGAPALLPVAEPVAA